MSAVQNRNPAEDIASFTYVSALATAFTEHRGTIARYVSKRISDPAAVEDRVQEVFTRLARNVSTEPVISWKALLLRVAQSVVVDQWRRENARNETMHLCYEDEMYQPAVDPEPFEALVARDRLARLKRAILKLDTLERDIVLLARLEGLGHKAIGAQLGIDSVSVSRTLYKAIAKLAAEVDGA